MVHLLKSSFLWMFLGLFVCCCWGKIYSCMSTPSFVLSCCLLKRVLALSTWAIPYSAFNMLLEGSSYSLWVLWASLMLSKNAENEPWLMWLSGLNIGLRTKGSLVRFPVRAIRFQARSSVGGAWEATTHWCFSLSFSFLSPLSKNK